VRIEKGNPQQNCYIERFDGTRRDELLNALGYGARVHHSRHVRVRAQPRVAITARKTTIG
jgi:hypothetical protein